MRAASFVATLVCALAILTVPSAIAGEPPNTNDPCSTAGRDTCGTTGLGFYKEYRYGLRWFGDFRGAVPGALQTFCIDFRYWYPSPAYAFRESTRPLRNRDNEPVSAGNQQRLAYAIWNDGRTSSANQQAAVTLYVHSLMGDGRAGETDPSALGPAVVSLYEQIARDAARYHGPYRIETQVPAGLVVGKPANVTVRVLSATGNAVPGAQLSFTAAGAVGLPGPTQTDASGVARVTVTPSASTFQLSVRASGLASTLPRVYAPTRGLAVRNGQRLVAPDSQVLTAVADSVAGKSRIAVSSEATPTRLAIGEVSRDRVTISGALKGWRGAVAVRIFGPSQSVPALDCSGEPAWKGSFTAAGPGVYTTPPAALERVGWYTYVEEVASDANHIGVTTPCKAPGETFRVETQPRVRTVVSSDRVAPGTEIRDRILVGGLAGQKATVEAFLYGPFGSREVISCAAQPVWTGSIAVEADAEYVTEPFKVTVPGYYTYRETIAARGFVRSAETKCGEVAETAVAVGRPKITTQVSSQETRPGASITDRAVVSGLGVLEATVQVRLWGPFARRGLIECAGTPYWSGSFAAHGDGTYVTAPVQLDRAGYYIYQESIEASPAVEAFSAPCGDAAETTFSRAQPSVTTIASDEVLFPGAAIHDRIRVRGLGKTAAAIDVELFGPFEARAAIGCTGRPFWKGRVFAQGDGELRTPAVRVKRAGFYTWREHLVASASVAETTTECALAVETSLARPEIITGRGDKTHWLAGRRAGAMTPTRIRLASRGIDAPVFSSRINTVQNILAVPANIRQTGWWSDGAEPGSAAGAILIAGHVDSKLNGIGSFFRLKDAKAGERVEVRTAGGRTFAYRVVSVKNYLKSKLPTSVFSTKGARRLVVVTCGGPFNEASNHYRDNVVLTAVPL